MTLLYPLLVVLLAVFAVAPLGYPGAFQSHTGLLAVYNLINLDQNPLAFFQWSPVVGRSYDWLRGEGLLPYLLAEIAHRAGLSYLDSIKAVYALAWIAGGLTLYALARRLASRAGSLLAATVYVYLPFHLAAVYVRGAFAESVAWALLPLAFLVAVYPPTMAWRSRATWLALAPFALLFLTTPGLALVAGIVALGLAVALNGRITRALVPSMATIGGGLLAGLVLNLPVMLRYGLAVPTNGFVPNYVLPFQLFSSLWGYGQSTGSFLDKFPLQLGVVPLVLAMMTIILARQAKPDDRTATAWRTVVALLGASLVLVLLTLEITAPLWALLRVFVTYPWQLLLVAGCALAISAGAVVEFDARLTRPAMLSVLLILPVIATYSWLTPRWLDANPTRPQIAVFGTNEIALLDYRIVGPLRHGATLRVELSWQALREVDHDYTVFIHAVNQDDGRTYGEQDGKPQDGSLPTVKLSPGQVISDTHWIQIDVDGPRDNYVLELGLYQSANGNRALLDTGADRLILPRPGDPEPIISDQMPIAKNP